MSGEARKMRGEGGTYIVRGAHGRVVPINLPNSSRPDCKSVDWLGKNV